MTFLPVPSVTLAPGALLALTLLLACLVFLVVLAAQRTGVLLKKRTTAGTGADDPILNKEFEVMMQQVEEEREKLDAAIKAAPRGPRGYLLRNLTEKDKDEVVIARTLLGLDKVFAAHAHLRRTYEGDGPYGHKTKGSFSAQHKERIVTLTHTFVAVLRNMAHMPANDARNLAVWAALEAWAQRSK